MEQTTIFHFIPRHDAKCEICGNQILKPSRFKPRKYCGDECANYARFKDALEKSILKLNPTKEAKSLIRGDMFRLANILSKRTETSKECIMKLKDRLKKKKEEPVTISVRIPFELDQWVRACANKYGVTITDVVIATIEEVREEMLKNGDWR